MIDIGKIGKSRRIFSDGVMQRHSIFTKNKARQDKAKIKNIVRQHFEAIRINIDGEEEKEKKARQLSWQESWPPFYI